MIGFDYDPAGRPSYVDRRNGRDTLYQYDPVSRPNVLINTSFGSPGDVRFDYAFNPASQVVSQSRDNDGYAFTAIAAANKSYSINGLNQYTAVAGTSHTYDANGNLTGDGSNAYIYDGENRLVSATSAGVTATLTYDPLGRLWRVQKGTSDTRFLYDGDALVAEYDASGALAKRYVHGSNAAADDPLVDYVGATLANRRFLETDHQGSVILIADNAGATIATNRYDEYGVPQGTNQGRFQYTGQIWLSELNLYHYKARLYSPYLGRFLQVDPIGYKDQMNLYAYVGDDPVSATDETGERITPVGSSREQEELKRLILKVARSAPALRVRYEILARSSIQHVVRSADVGERSGSATSIPWNASHGQGSSTTNRINLKGEVLFWDKPGWASPEDIVAHELFGHAYDADRGRLDKTLNPNTQVRYSEESAVAVENEYRASAGEPLRNTYGGRRVGPYPYRQQQKQDPCPRATGASSTCGSGIDGVWQ